MPSSSGPVTPPTTLVRHRHPNLTLWVRSLSAEKRRDAVCFLALQATLGISSWIATLGFHRSQAFVDVSGNPTPLGYTKSLVLFIVPCLMFAIWLLLSFRTKRRTRRKAFAITILALFPLGCILDYFFAPSFLTFKNPGSVLPFGIPPFHPSPAMCSKVIPIEEFLFYFLGFLAILLTYVWSDHVMFSSTKVTLEHRRPVVFRNWPTTIAFWLLIGGLLFAIAFAIRQGKTGDGPCPFPGYFLFLLITAILPSMICSRLAVHFVNFRALTAAWLLVLAISQFWEAALGIPYQWWGYQLDRMMGLTIKAQCDLPVEAVIVWTLATWTTVVIYETVLNVLRIKDRAPHRRLHEILKGEDSDVIPLKEYYAGVKREERGNP